MMKRVVLIALVLIAATGIAFGQNQPWAKSYNADGQLNGYASAGIGFGWIEATLGAELIIGQFDIAGVPLDWGVMGRGLLNVWPFVGFGLDWGAAVMGSLHLGITFYNLELYVALGPALYGNILTYVGAPAFGFGLASFNGVIWHISDTFGLLFEGGYAGYTSVYGVGVALKL